MEKLYKTRDLLYDYRSEAEKSLWVNYDEEMNNFYYSKLVAFLLFFGFSMDEIKEKYLPDLEEDVKKEGIKFKADDYEARFRQAIEVLSDLRFKNGYETERKRIISIMSAKGLTIDAISKYTGIKKELIKEFYL